ncbi:MAG: TolC family protein [Candidatus Omnitrophica bacterium]|nr:TolC family protein [Candidatus Omnitrophota bacterium]
MGIKKIFKVGIVTIVLVLFVDIAFAEIKANARKKQLKKIEKNINKEIDLPDIPAIDDYVRVGLLRSPALKASFYKWKASFNKITQAFSLPDPMFTFTEYIDKVETRVGPQERAYSIMQKIPLPDKLWIKKDKAFKASEQAYYMFEKKRLDLIFNIHDAYYEYAYLSKAIALTEENMKLLQNFESVAQAKYATGTAKNQDLLKVQVELGKLENELLSLRDLRKPLVSRLNALLNFPENKELPWPNESLDIISVKEEYNVPMDDLANSIKNNNPELLSLSENIKKHEKEVQLSYRDYFPDLSIGVKTIDTNDALNPNMLDSGKDPLMIMFSVNVPIWFWRIDAKVNEAKASLATAKNMQVAKEQELLSRLSLIHYKFRDALRQSGLYKQALIPKAVQTLNATRSGYQAGHVDFLSLIDAQRVLLNFELAYYRHTANVYQRYAEVKNLLGEIEKGPFAVKEDL